MDQAVNTSEEKKAGTESPLSAGLTPPAAHPDDATVAEINTPNKTEAITSTQPDTVSTEATAPAVPEKPKGKFVSTGYKVHNEVTYRVVDWLLNSAIAVGFAFWSKQTERGQRWFTRPIEERFSKLLKPVLKPENLKSGSEWGAAFISIMVGGTLIIPVMMGLENKKNKKGIIRWLDEKIYGKDEVENNPKFQESYDKIDEEPKKNFGTGMAARFAVLLPMIAMTVSPLNKYVKEFYYDYISKGSKFVGEKLRLKPKFMEETATNGVGTKWDYLHQTIGFDVGLTFIYSFCHEFAYKALAALGFKKHETPTNVKDPKEEIGFTSFNPIEETITNQFVQKDETPAKTFANATMKSKPVNAMSLTDRAIRTDDGVAMGV